MTRALLLYLLAVNLASVVLFGVDKERARTGGWRIKESWLHLAGLAGGFPGGLLAMQVFRHKRRKAKFFLVYWGVSLVSAALIWWFADQVLGIV